MDGCCSLNAVKLHVLEDTHYPGEGGVSITSWYYLAGHQGKLPAQHTVVAVMIFIEPGMLLYLACTAGTA